jgi:hypothetical protein
MSFANVDAAEDSEFSRLTIVARTFVISVGRFATWKVYRI